MKHAIVIVALILLAALCFIGWIEKPLASIGQARLQESNDTYLSTSLNKALGGFMTMSILKAGLDIIEGSEVGIGLGVTANLQVGDLAQPAYDYVDIVWRTLFTSCVVLVSIRYLLQAAATVDSYVFGVTLLLLAAFLTKRWWRGGWPVARTILRDTLSIAIVATLALYYLLPLSVYGASKLSQAITQPQIEEAQKGFERTKQALFPEDQQSPNGIITKLKQTPDRIEQIAAYLNGKLKDMVVWAITLTAGYIFDCIVFPLGLFVLLLWFTRSIVRCVLQRNAESSLREDLERILVRKKN